MYVVNVSVTYLRTVTVRDLLVDTVRNVQDVPVNASKYCHNLPHHMALCKKVASVC